MEDGAYSNGGTYSNIDRKDKDCHAKRFYDWLANVYWKKSDVFQILICMWDDKELKLFPVKLRPVFILIFLFILCNVPIRN